jgi:hypothetical protein
LHGHQLNREWRACQEEVAEKLPFRDADHRLARAYLADLSLKIMANATKAATAMPTSATIIIALSLFRRSHRDERGNKIFAKWSNIVLVQIQGEKCDIFRASILYQASPGLANEYRWMAIYAESSAKYAWHRLEFDAGRNKMAGAAITHDLYRRHPPRRPVLVGQGKLNPTR